MRKLILPLLLFLSACACAPGVSVTKPNILGAALPAAEAHELLLQAVKYSRYKMPKYEPIVDLVPNSVWIRDVCNNNRDCAASSLGYYGIIEAGDSNVVHVRRTPLVFNRPYPGVAVHELVHWLQVHNGWVWKPHNCGEIAAHEAEAYAVEYVRDVALGLPRKLDIGDIYQECVLNHGG